MKNNIKRLRKSLGWTQDQLGEKIGIAAQTVQKLEQGHMRLTDEYLEQLIQVFDCSPNDIFEGFEKGNILFGKPLEGSISKDLALYQDAMKKAVEYLENRKKLDLHNLIDFVDKLWRYQQEVGEADSKIVAWLYIESLKKFD